MASAFKELQGESQDLNKPAWKAIWKLSPGESESLYVDRISQAAVNEEHHEEVEQRIGKM